MGVKLPRELFRRLLGITSGPGKICLGHTTLELTEDMKIMVEVHLSYVEPGMVYAVLDAYKQLWETRHSILEIEGRIKNGTNITRG